MADEVCSPAIPMESMRDLLWTRAARHSDRVALRFVADDGQGEHSLTYGDLRDQARRIAGLLLRRADPGARVLLVCPPGLDFVTAFFGCVCAGMVAVPTSAPPPRRLDREAHRLRAVLEDSGATIVITSSELGEPLAAIFAQEALRPPVAVLTCDDLRTTALIEPEQPLPKRSRNDLALLQYTSGSTRTPRGVMISHGNLLCNLQRIQEAFGTSETTVGVFWLPFHHDMGLIGGLLGTLFCGGTSTLFSPLAFVLRPVRWLQLISERRANISGGPNFAYDECVRRIPAAARTGLDLRSWDVAFCGAEPIHAATLDRFADAFSVAGFRGEAFLPCYGLAESTLLVTGGAAGRPLSLHRRNAQNLKEPVRVGCGVPREGQRVRIVSPETRRECPEGDIGEIWVAGESVGQGYWGLPAESQETFLAFTADGDGPFLRTGDLGYFWSGELFISGRLKDLVIVNGRNHSPHDLERTVQGCHPLLRENGCAAFSVEQDQHEQLVIVAEVEPRLWARELSHGPEAGARFAEAARSEIVKSITDQHEVTPAKVLLVPAFSIPRTTSGKLRRRACREAYLAGELRAVQ